MEIKIKGNKEDISMLLISAERYALGRRTYIVDWTCEFISNNLHLLTNKDRQIIIKDLTEPICGYGDACDKACWLALLDKLKE